MDEVARSGDRRTDRAGPVMTSAAYEGSPQLVVSELVTNARKHAPGPCLVDPELSGDSVGIAVWDTAPVLPVAKAADPGRVGQHGLEIVMAVCQGFEVHREPVGKRITASVMPADDPGGDVAGRSPV